MRYSRYQRSLIAAALLALGLGTGAQADPFSDEVDNKQIEALAGQINVLVGEIENMQDRRFDERMEREIEGERGSGGEGRTEGPSVEGDPVGQINNAFYVRAHSSGALVRVSAQDFRANQQAAAETQKAQAASEEEDEAADESDE